MEMVMFFILAIVAVAAGVGVIAQRSAVRSALFLLVNFCCLAGLYILLNAQFVAIVQVIIYAGAVVVLFLFVVMLLGAEKAGEESEADAGLVQRVADRPATYQRIAYQQIAGVLLGVLLLAGILWAVGSSLFPAETGTALARSDNIREIGAALLTDFALPFEMASIVLLVAIIGAVVLAKRRLT
jgi:NADH-quinone oxidoreductase subunit J